MIPISDKLLLAMDAVFSIACNDSGQPVSSKEISEKLGIQQRYLEQILQRFVREGILKGVRGPRGGYTLAKEKRKVTLGSICRAYFKGEELENGAVKGTTLGKKIIFPAVEQLKESFISQLEGKTLESLYEEAEKSGLLKKQPERIDFTI